MPWNIYHNLDERDAEYTQIKGLNLSHFKCISPVLEVKIGKDEKFTSKLTHFIFLHTQR